jgi:flagellar motility protein MotE (MotC chaperone)
MELNSEARTLKREIAKLEEELKTLENNQEQYIWLTY